MGSKRRLCISSLALLRGESHPCPRIPHPHPRLSRSFLLSRGPRVSDPRALPSPLESRISSVLRHCSESGGVGAAASVCWNCGAAAASSPFLVCGSCRSVQPVDNSVDYFQIFGLEKGYESVTDNLEGKYKEWQKKLHPDLVHSKSEKEKSFAAEQSARVIDAYRTLKEPLSKALYLLKLEGIDIDEENTITDPDLLTEMMEIRENVEEANDSLALKNIKSQIQKKFETWSISFLEASRKRDFDAAMAAIQRMRYYDKAVEEIIKKL